MCSAAVLDTRGLLTGPQDVRILKSSPVLAYRSVSLCSQSKAGAADAEAAAKYPVWPWKERFCVGVAFCEGR